MSSLKILRVVLRHGLNRVIDLNLIFSVFFLTSSVRAAEPLPVNTNLNESVISITKKGTLFNFQLETTLFKPDGEGPFPMVIINHGKQEGDTSWQPRYRPLVAARYFLQLGYVVAVPMRQGFSKSTGTYIGAGCNIESNGRVQAEDVVAVLEYFAGLPYVDKTKILVIGQSHGGWTTLAFGTQNYPGVRGLVNFAGGLRQDGCGVWQTNLVRAVGNYGKQTKLPSLWFYGDNDSFFSPDTFRPMHQAYTANGARSKLIAFGNFAAGDAHGMFGSRAGQEIWQPEMTAFLNELGLPNERRFPQFAELESPPRTDFAGVTDASAVPHIGEKGKAGYTVFLGRSFPRAFAISASGAWGFADGGDDPLRRALQTCNRSTKQACRLYAIDDYVVW